MTIGIDPSSDAMWAHSWHAMGNVARAQKQTGQASKIKQTARDDQTTRQAANCLALLSREELLAFALKIACWAWSNPLGRSLDNFNGIQDVILELHVTWNTQFETQGATVMHSFGCTQFHGSEILPILRLERSH